MPFDTHTRGVQRHVVLDGVPDPRKGEIRGGQTPSQNLQVHMYDSLGGITYQQFRVLLNYFGLV